MDKIKYNSLNLKISQMPAQTFEIIQKLINYEYICKCNKPIMKNDEIYSCKNCYYIFHIKCLNIKRLNLKTSKKLKIRCEKCNEDIPCSNEPFYDCFCGKFYTNQENPDFNPILIPHGCGLICNFIVCSHKNCTLPCHPGEHEICNNCKQFDNNFKKNENENNLNKYDKENLYSNNMTYSENMSSQTNNITSIINIKGKQKILGISCENDSDIVYCGRKNFMGGWKLKESIWANPFKVSDYCNNETACLKYEEYIRNNEELLSNLKDLVGKKLACWCFPEPCHCEVLIKLMKERNLI